MNNVWTDADAAALRIFLENPTGQKVLLALVRPQFKSQGFENVALDSRFSDGVDTARNVIINLSNYKEAPKDNKVSSDILTLNQPEPR